jgi:hypothetical protein
MCVFLEVGKVASHILNIYTHYEALEHRAKSRISPKKRVDCLYLPFLSTQSISNILFHHIQSASRLLWAARNRVRERVVRMCCDGFLPAGRLDGWVEMCAYELRLQGSWGLSRWTVGTVLTRNPYLQYVPRHISERCV